MTPRYYRGLPDWLWATLGVFVVLAALVWGALTALDIAKASGRADAFAEGKAAAAIVFPAERARWSRERDSLVAAAAVRDTVLVERIRTVRRIITDTVVSRDTAPDDSTLLHACTALANDCDSFRVTATAALAAADSVRRADSLAAVRLIYGGLATRDSLQSVRKKLDRAPSWKTTAGVGFTAAAAGVLLCVVLCR